jgi:hypothetical protein
MAVMLTSPSTDAAGIEVAAGVEVAAGDEACRGDAAGVAPLWFCAVGAEQASIRNAAGAKSSGAKRRAERPRTGYVRTSPTKPRRPSPPKLVRIDLPPVLNCRLCPVPDF